jgi:hypothetical protein
MDKPSFFFRSISLTLKSIQQASSGAAGEVGDPSSQKPLGVRNFIVQNGLA